MRKLLSPILYQRTDELLIFQCPGCNTIHQIVFAGPGAWGYNGDPEKPTFTHSVLVTSPNRKTTHVCHSFVKDGQIQFLNDCTHSMAGQTVPLAPIPDWLIHEGEQETA